MCARKAKPEIRQGQIPQAAFRLLGKRGGRRVGLAAIAKEVAIVPSDACRHFTGGDQVLGRRAGTGGSESAWGLFAEMIPT